MSTRSRSGCSGEGRGGDKEAEQGAGPGQLSFRASRGCHRRRRPLFRGRRPPSDVTHVPRRWSRFVPHSFATLSPLSLTGIVITLSLGPPSCQLSQPGGRAHATEAYCPLGAASK
ncbi:hypothetical protein SRHO_G00328300 [Serrasalmus rhombeus]